MKDIRRKIKEKRVGLGWSRDKLAALSGVTSKTIHTIEESDALPSTRILMKVCDVLGLSIVVIDSSDERKFNASEVREIVEAAISKIVDEIKKESFNH